MKRGREKEKVDIETKAVHNEKKRDDKGSERHH